MATWIVHLRIAGSLLDRIPSLDQVPFLVGNIAPDSGIPDENWENFDPPPKVTHFQLPSGPRRSADLDFFRGYLGELTRTDPRFSFRLGYFFHLVTDNLWYEVVGLPTQIRWGNGDPATNDFWNEVKKDWYGLDFVYLRDHPGFPAWNIFRRLEPPAETGLGFLPGRCLAHNMRHIQAYYQSMDDEIREMIDRSRVYLTEHEMVDFVQMTCDRLNWIYRKIWIEGGNPGCGASVLDSLLD